MTVTIGRRELLAALGGAAAAWPLAARAQQSAMPVIGWLHSATPGGSASRAAAFRQGLNEAGFAEGRNIAIEYRAAENQIDRLPTLAAELVRRQVSVIAAGGSPASALAAKSATATIPIVFANSADPVQLGLVASLSRPGGNVTGVTTISTELEAKRLGLLRELVPSATSIAVLVNPRRPGVDAQLTQAQEAARALGLPLHILNASSEGDFDAAFLRLVQLRAGALAIASDALFTYRRDQIVAMTRRHSAPPVHHAARRRGSGVAALLANPAFANFDRQVNEVQEAAREASQQLLLLRASSEEDIDAAFAMAAERQTKGLLVAADPFMLSRRERLVALAARYAIPAIYEAREYATAGGLMSYGISLTNAYRQAGVYTGRILTGEKPSDLPVLQPTKFEFIVNLKTAKALGIKVSDNLLSLADEVGGCGLPVTTGAEP
jgi:putative tryptophan/tyrosine transport system substrate-binding protein